MPSGSKVSALVFTFCLVNLLTVAVGESEPLGAQASSQAAQAARPAQNTQSGVDIPEEVPDEELAPAVLELDVSKTSPLIQVLYQATRETKEDAILARLDDARKLIGSGADLKTTDEQGRTALHWAVFGSSYNTRPKIVVAYEEVADAMIQKGIDINHQDAYQDTPLDYLLYAPNFEMQTLLIENGATSGFLAAFQPLFHPDPDGSPAPQQISTARKPDLLPGATMSVRLDNPVYSDRSRTGDPVSGTVTYPVCKNGEQLACNEGELLVPPGTKVNGTILFAQKAPNKYARPRLVLDFSNIMHKNGQRSPLYARVLDVDNARETIRNNEILGIIQPHASTKLQIAMAALSASNPIAGYSIKGVQTVYGLSIRREILFPAGTDVQIQLVRASTLRQKESWEGWPTLKVDPVLQHLCTTAPLRTFTAKNVPSDLTNLIFLGTQQQLTAAFAEARWIQADDLTIRSALKVAQATMRQTGYSSAPVSALLIDGRLPDLVFQKSLNTFAKRHHIRVWKLSNTYQGREVWIGAATHDIDTSSERAGTKWSHRIDPHIDRERDWVETDLLFAGTASAYANVDRPNAPRKAANATGDDIVTDGKISVVQIATPDRPGNPIIPKLAERPKTAVP